MNKRFLSVAAFAVLVAGGASVVMYRLIVSRMTATAIAAQPKVVVAARNLELGALVHDADLKLVDWAGPVPPQTIRNQADIVGRGVVANIYEGEPVLESRLAPRGAGAGLATLIPKGMRAAAVRVDEVVGLAGFASPGMRVDVLMSGAPPGDSRGGSETKTILQNIEVLSAGQIFQKDAEGRPVSSQVVNLLVTPDQAESLNLASTQTHIQLVLRNPLDTEQAATSGRMLAQLFGQPATPPVKAAPAPRPKPVEPPRAITPPPPPPPAPPRVQVQVKVVEVVTGAKKTEAKFTETPEEKP
jgi:pilus assembly protein CpaB